MGSLRGRMDCALCAIKSQAFRVVKETKNTFVCVNVEPFVEGHVMVLPKAHRVSYGELTMQEAQELFALVQEMSHALRRAYASEAALTMVNHGVTQTQEHVHMHIIPNKKNEGARSMTSAFFKKPFRVQASREDLEKMKLHIQAYLK